MPQTVWDRNDLPVLEQALVGLLGMEYVPEDVLNSERPSLASLEILCVDLVTTMEQAKILRAREWLRSMKEFAEQSERDQLLLRALEHWTNRRFEESHRNLRQVLNRYPQDILAVWACHMLEFYMGWISQMLTTMQLVRDAWNAQTPLLTYFKAIDAFSLEENGNFEQALTSANLALTLNARNVYAIHVVCHYYYETGQFYEGSRWMEAHRSEWCDNSSMRIHIWWHYAIFRLYLMDIAQVYEIYDQELRRKSDPNSLEDLDAASLLWRLHLLGYDDSSRWMELYQSWKHYGLEEFYWFNDLHALIVLLANGYGDKAAALAQHSITRSEPGSQETLRHALRGFAFFEAGECQWGLEDLWHAMQGTPFGGSNAQRDILELTVAVAITRLPNGPPTLDSLIDLGRSLKYETPLRNQLLSQMRLGVRENG
ncbi:hypothetical protein [Sulfobacillus sp. hq2]|uniref:hypothetical protein n=1 Tax=Sulfobacillus TaxID=28033 RepID=UPI000CD2DE83|nr:hypothetical protein [Sulfobacillus sp. hq2]POB11764.1 hypothetical protein CO251_02870 [Sulfobacillus sp. hq2]